MEKSVQAELFPGDIPPDIPHCVVLLWRAYFRWWGTGTTDSPTRVEFRQKFELGRGGRLPGLRTIDTWRHDNPTTSPSWPLKRGERPPWAPPLALPAPADDQRNGHSVDRPIVVQAQVQMSFHGGLPRWVDVVIDDEGRFRLAGDALPEIRRE